MWLSVVLMGLVLLCILSLIAYSEHPISVGFWFVWYSLMVTFWVGVEWSSYGGYLIFFVYVGALLVMFCMVVSLTPNPVFRVVPFVSLFPLGVEMKKSTSPMMNKECEFNLLGDNVLGNLGVYDSVGWGLLLVWLGLMLLLSMISVISMCKWSSGPLVRFKYKHV
uniref:NADH dehydrogenase subunit 6 n=1 Tax=Pillucina pisidium (Dunker, 1860) TaxID=244488 RepID=UPI00233E8916|nr:NADH dehydrogenase subunit 6 [Pillucina pisidium (Dunker, 1860)]WBR65409.1 NADH dehydrogenase subunit 6 [Pillucina pisidium (Dunker, 1860)]